MDQRLGHGIGHSSQVSGVEVNYLRGLCGVTRLESKNNESVYERCGMGPCAHEVKGVFPEGTRLFFYITNRFSLYIKRVPVEGKPK